jgi:methionyl-tRNA synthetase
MSHEEFPTDRPAVVTCGLPYANGDLHIGHLRGYVGADIYERALERLGQQAVYVCGSDMHGTPVAVNAAREGIDPEAFALRYYEEHRALFPRFNVDFDHYGHTRQETNVDLTEAAVRTLEERGYILEKPVQVAYDPEADQYLPDRYVEGECPYCGALARGDECDEGCGRHLEPGEVVDPVSTVTGNPAEYRERVHKFFRLEELQDYLQSFIERLEGTENARNQPREWIFGELKDWCITRDMDWGIDYPGEVPEGRDKLVLYVWVDAPMEYVASTKQYSEQVGADVFDWEPVWTGGEGEIVHVIGRDIIQHHAVFWPALLHGIDYTEPRAVLASGFMTLDGKGFSKSRNRAVWAEEYLEEGFHPDLLRYYLATNGGFQQDIDFSWTKFRERVNGELVGTVGNFLYRALLFAHRNYGGTPDAPVSREVDDRIAAALERYREAINDYAVRDPGQIAVKLAQFGNEYIQRHEPWNLVDDEPDRARQVVRDCVQIAKAVGVLLEPYTPEKAEGLWHQLDEEGSIHDVTLEAALEPAPDDFGAPEELFEKVPEERVEELTAKLEARVAGGEADAGAGTDAGAETEAEAGGGADAGEAATPDVEALAEERISFEQFQELDLRVGRIEAAEPVEGADELVRMEVDIGVETRQIVAGLRQLHDVDTLPGTPVVVVANLEKAELFGVESDGMVLAAGEEADLLATHGDSPPGTKVR